ncbi:MAG: TRAP transporter small permease [Formivibrio sp.]|nr:TRAP transporter small permease [Formivibrio sp.]
MSLLTALNSRLSRWALYIACIGLTGLVCIVDYSVVMRYIFNDSPVFAEQAALLMVITVAMFGASAGVRDAGHIGMDIVVLMTPEKWHKRISVVVHCINAFFGALLFSGCLLMADSVYQSTIPTLGISEAVRYLPPIGAGILIILFSIEHLMALFTNKKVIPSWH